jgi:hypothetical protein
MGSASLGIMRGVSESLAGRVSFVDISGFDLGEVGNKYHGRGYPAVSEETKNIVKDTMPSAKKQIQWSKIRKRWRRDKNISGEIKTLAKR